jgi:hypothetical protein
MADAINSWSCQNRRGRHPHSKGSSTSSNCPSRQQARCGAGRWRPCAHGNGATRSAAGTTGRCAGCLPAHAPPPLNCHHLPHRLPPASPACCSCCCVELAMLQTVRLLGGAWAILTPAPQRQDSMLKPMLLERCSQLDIAQQPAMMQAAVCHPGLASSLKHEILR